MVPSLLKVFAIFELRLIETEEKLDAIYIRCINCKKATGLFLRNSTFEEIITRFVSKPTTIKDTIKWFPFLTIM